MLANEYSFSLPTIGLVSKYEQWTIPGYTNRKDNVDGFSGKRGMVRAGGSASRTIGDQSSTDPGGGFRRRTKQRTPQWQMPAGRNKGRHWAANNSQSWERRRIKSGIQRNRTVRPVQVPQIWTSWRQLPQRRLSGNLVGRCARLKKFGPLLTGTLLDGHGESRRPQ